MPYYWHLIFLIIISCFALSLARDIYLYSNLVLLYHKHMIHLYNHILFCLIIWHVIYIYNHILFRLMMALDIYLYSYLVKPYNWHLIFFINISCFASSFGTWYIFIIISCFALLLAPDIVYNYILFRLIIGTWYIPIIISCFALS